MYWCPEVCIYTQKSTQIWKVYLNYSKCTWKVSILLYKHHAIIESRATRHSALSAFTETVEFLERSLWDIAAAWLAVIFFLDIIGSQKRIATYNFHSLLAASNNQEDHWWGCGVWIWKFWWSFWLQRCGLLIKRIEKSQFRMKLVITN